MELSNQQKLFCQKYVELGMNGTQAYLSVYKNVKKEATARTNASRLLTKANIKEYIEELQSKTEKKAIVNIEDRMRWLSDVINGKEKEKHYYYQDGEYLHEGREADINTKIKALDTLNKMDGIYTTKHKISGDNENPINIVDLSHLSTEEIRELLEIEDKR